MIVCAAARVQGRTPAQAAGITKRRHLFSDTVAMIDADFEERRPKTRGPYKKRQPNND